MMSEFATPGSAYNTLSKGKQTIYNRQHTACIDISPMTETWEACNTHAFGSRGRPQNCATVHSNNCMDILLHILSLSCKNLKQALQKLS